MFNKSDCDNGRNEWRELEMDTLPNNNFLLKKIPANACKQAQYWEKVFELAGIPNDNNGDDHYAKSVHIRSYAGPYFPAFGINTER